MSLFQTGAGAGSGSSGFSFGQSNSNNNNNSGSGGNLFGAPSNNTTGGSSGGLFGNSNSTNNSNSGGSGLFGNNNNTSSNTNTTSTTSLFGNNNSGSSNSTGTGLFGNNSNPSSNNSSNPSMFGNTNTASSLNNRPSPMGSSNSNSLFGSQPQQQQQQQQPSLFSNQNQASTSANTSLQGTSIFNQSTNSSFSQSVLGANSGNSGNHNTNSNSLMASGGPLVQSHSTMELSSGLYNSPSRVSTPSWRDKDRRHIPSHLSQVRQKSSFSTPDRVTMTTSSRHGSVSAQSPPSYGTSFGTPKPAHTKRNNIIDEEDLPPTESIYDVSQTSSAKAHNYGSGLKRSESFGGASHSLSSKRLDQTGNESSLLPANGNGASGSGVGVSGAEDTSENSVVVFGFPPTLATLIIKHFSRFGEILENVTGGGQASPSKHKANKFAPLPVQSGSNWIKITYSNATSAQRALNENGTLFANQYLIGCTAVNQTNSRDLVSAGETSMQPIDEQQMEIDSPPRQQQEQNVLNGGSANNESAGQQPQQQKTVPRTISMPVLPGGGKRIQVQNNKSIFNNKKSVRMAPSLSNIKEQDTKSKSKQGWLSWTTKRAQELVFGWDDL